MRLYHILTRCVGTGKMNVTRKLLDRVRREVGGNPCSKPEYPRRRKRGGLMRASCAALVVALTISCCLVGTQAAASAEPGDPNLEQCGYTAAALFNQANADARNGKTGRAVLNFERALLLAPNDGDIAANLHFIRAKAGLPDRPESWYTHSLTYARPNTLAWLGCFGLILAGTSLLVGHLFPQRQLAFRSLTFASALLVLTAMASAVTIWPRFNEAVVIAREAPARTSPVLAAEPAFMLREGETVTAGAEHQDFVLVQTSAGRSGWVARAELARVVPRSARRT